MIFWQSYAPFTLKMIWNFQFPFIISPNVQYIPLKLDIWMRQMNAQVKFKFGHGSMIFGFHFESNMKFSVYVYYLPNSTTYSTQIWHMDMFLECPGQVRIWSWFNVFWQSKAPFTLKIIWNLQFLFIIYPTVLHIQLKFDIWICQRNGQVKLKFGHGWWFFGRVMSLSLWNNIDTS
jgi:hypothetical protein